jgi:hypothetical protein
MDRALSEYFCIPAELASVEVDGPLSKTSGFFQFGNDVICYGQFAGGTPSNQLDQSLPDALQSVRFEGGGLKLPFDLSSVADNLRRERYTERLAGLRTLDAGNAAHRAYYFLRPALPVRVRRYLQRIRLDGWADIPFPRWPVDFTVECLMERILAIILKHSGMDRLPFIWFWPEGAPSCVMMTHDVESLAGLKYCHEMMDLDDSYGIKSAFQVVPETRYETTETFLQSLRDRGFELNVHDLNHDGSLFLNKDEFNRQAARINHYIAKFRTQGFRAGTMYRNQDWYASFDFSYDMSVPNVAHLEPQRGGCCTVMPYFVGKILELPLTTVQDYSLFHILGDYSIELWKLQIDSILKRHGLISFIVHPDYTIEKRSNCVYTDLLRHLNHIREERKLWFALPSEVNRWWQSRNKMRLVEAKDQWKIEGPEHERARVAYAKLDGDRLAYSIENSS